MESHHVTGPAQINPRQPTFVDAMNMQPISPELEKLILIEEISDYESSQDDRSLSGTWPQKSFSLESDVSMLKAENTYKLQKRWDEIIAKYSTIDDERESDEIDLNSGCITIDNGHLRSFLDDGAEINGAKALSSIWETDDKLEKGLRKHKHSGKQKRRLCLEKKDCLKASSLFYHKSTYFIDPGSDVLEDNILLLSPSPTKKHKPVPSSPGSLTRLSPTKNIFSSGRRLGTPALSPLKGKLPSVVTSPSETVRGSPKRNTHNASTYNSSTYMKCELLPQSEDNPSEEEGREYDELCLISELFDTGPYAFFKCAFYGCRYTSFSKHSYRAHLLSSHSPELQQIGYPVQAEKRYNFPLPGDTIPKLNVHFPLKIALPSGRPYACATKLESGQCRKVFIDKKHLIRHSQQIPSFCSTKKQVFVCPLLGCDFMTDTSYEEFHDHISSHQNDRLRQSLNYLGSSAPTVKEVSKYSSDSVSSLTCSDMEDQNHLDDYHSVKEAFRQGKVRSLTSETPTQDTVPKLNILDGSIDIHGYRDDDAEGLGYSSIEELFEDDAPH